MYAGVLFIIVGCFYAQKVSLASFSWCN